MISVGLDRQINFYDVQSKKKIQSIKCPDAQPLQSLAFNSDGFTIAVGTQGKHASVLIYDLRTQTDQPLASLQGHPSTVNALAFSHEDTKAVSARPSAAASEQPASASQIKTME